MKIQLSEEMESLWDLARNGNDDQIKAKKLCNCIIFIMPKERDKDGIGKGKFGVHSIAPRWDTENEKVACRDEFFRHLSKMETQGYIILFDTFVTEMNPKTKKTTRAEAAVRTVYTPKGKIMEVVKYKDGEILNKKVMTCGKNTKMKDQWDYWNVGKPMSQEEIDKAEEERDKAKAREMDK